MFSTMSYLCIAPIITGKNTQITSETYMHIYRRSYQHPEIFDITNYTKAWSNVEPETVDEDGDLINKWEDSIDRNRIFLRLVHTVHCLHNLFILII
jgi:hypothetical protein